MTEQEVDLRGVGEQRVFTLASFSSLTFGQKSPVSEGHVTLASRELKGFIASKYFMATETAKLCQVLQAGKSL
jgi:hypothetical protein